VAWHLRQLLPSTSIGHLMNLFSTHEGAVYYKILLTMNLH
jgi:hypothetical protein